MMAKRNTRLEELEHKFSQLASRLEESPQKEAISILHAMLQESLRQNATANPGPKSEGGTSIEDVANLYKSAPGMEGKAEKPGLSIGTKAPDFSLQDANGRAVSLSDYRGKNVVLAFYPLDWSPACSDQLSLYQSELSEFNKFNTQVLAISVDSLYSHGAWAAVRGVTIPLLADFNPKGEVARCYDVMRDSTGFSERAIFVIDGEGMIRYAQVSPELHMIPDIYELFDQLKTLNAA